MKKTLFLLIFYVIAMRSYSFGGYTAVTLKVGESYSITAANFNTSQTHLITGDAIITSYSGNGPMVFQIYAVKPGTASFSYYDKCVLFNVVDVVPNKIDIVIGENVTISPNIGSGVQLTWNSSNSSIATVTSNGVVSGVAVGRAFITCKDTNGTPFSCLVTVSPQLANSVTLNCHSSQLNVGDNVQLEASLLPNNVTNKQVKWLSSNENIAQVDEAGNVVTIASGHCSIFAIADDGSAKFDHCLITVSGTENRGDVNNDGVVDINDVTSIVKIIQGMNNNQQTGK